MTLRSSGGSLLRKASEQLHVVERSETGMFRGMIKFN